MKLRGLVVLTMVVLTMVALMSLLAASPSPGAGDAGKTPVTITLKEKTSDELGGTGTFSLLGASTADSDSGTVSFTETRIGFGRTAEGLAFERVRRSETLKGKHGTFVLRSTDRRFHVGVIDEDDYSATNTWTIARATGRYARFTGGGGGAGILRAITPHSRVHVYTYRYEGRLARS
jgi:hypothetical protein